MNDFDMNDMIISNKLGNVMILQNRKSVKGKLQYLQNKSKLRKSKLFLIKYDNFNKPYCNFLNWLLRFSSPKYQLIVNNKANHEAQLSYLLALNQN